MNSKSQKEILKQETQAKFPYLIEITTPDGEVYRYNNSDNNISYDGYIFEAGYFYIQPPKESNGVLSDATITISAVDQVWIKKIRQFDKRSTLRYIGLIMYDDDGTSYVEPCEDNTFYLTKASWNELTISWNMTLDDVMTIQIPCDTASPLNTTGAY